MPRQAALKPPAADAPPGPFFVETDLPRRRHESAQGGPGLPLSLLVRPARGRAAASASGAGDIAGPTPEVSVAPEPSPRADRGGTSKPHRHRLHLPRPWGGFGMPGASQRPGTPNPLLSSTDPERHGLIAGFRIDPQSHRVERLLAPPAPPSPPATGSAATASAVGAPLSPTDASAGNHGAGTSPGTAPAAANATIPPLSASPSHPWLWLHFDHNNPLSHVWLRHQSGVPAEAVMGMLAAQTRPRTVELDGGVLFIARGINLNPNSDPTDMVSLRVWIEHGRIITVVLRRVQSVAEVTAILDAIATRQQQPTTNDAAGAAAGDAGASRDLASGSPPVQVADSGAASPGRHGSPDSSEGDAGAEASYYDDRQGNGKAGSAGVATASTGARPPSAGLGQDHADSPLLHGPVDLLHQIVHRMVDHMVPLVQTMNDRLEDLVAGVIDENVEVTTAQLAPIRLQLITLHRYLAPLREALIVFSQLDRRWMPPTLRAKFREVADRVMRLVEELSAAQNRAAVARDEIGSQGAERLNRRVFSLTVLTAIFLPLTVLTGLLGMNVAGIPGASDPLAFLVVCTILGAVLGLQLLILRWLGWF